MRKHIRSIAGVLMAVMLAVTGLSAAAARGQQADAVGSMVICHGLTVATVLIDAEGNPVEARHICPDGAQALFADAGVSATGAVVSLTWRPILWGRIQVLPAGQDSPVAQARGPPVFL
ncbi:hypothetical protein [Antarctobacter jejuensis]|uniref:hypothetical protein n=1 Tax=Antarctobacter jejuensis TaxID=1439938 RepID=UPI003FD0A6D9